MAKKKANMSQLIRDYIDQHPDAKAGAVADAVGAQRGLVYNVMRSMKGGAKKQKNGKPRRSPAKAGGKHGDEFEAVREAARFIQSCGSIERAQQALVAAKDIASAIK